MQAETLMMQFSNVTLCFACFVFLVYFVVCNLAKMYIVGFFFFLEDKGLGKIEYFIVIRVKVSSSTGQDFVRVVDFGGNNVRLRYSCLCRCPSVTEAMANMESRVLSKDWTISCTLENCCIFSFRKAFERWQTFAVFQGKDEGFESLAPAQP